MVWPKLALVGLILCSLPIISCSGTSQGSSSAQPVHLTVQSSGTGAGSVTSSPSGISCGATCQADFVPGTAITLTATPTGDSVFAGWGGACSGTAPCKMTLTANATVTATF